MNDLTTLLAEFLDEVIHGDTSGKVLTANGVGVLPTFQASAGGSASLIHQASVTLTNTQIIHLPTINQDLIPAPGLGRSLTPFHGVLYSDHTTAGYGTFDAGGAYLAFYIDGVQRLNIVLASNGGVLSGGGIDVAFLSTFVGVDSAGGPANAAGSIEGARDSTSCENAALQIGAYNAGVDFSGGNIANALTVAVQFYVFDSSTLDFLTTTESGWNETTRTFV